MTRFKVGDRVRLVRVTHGDAARGFAVGQVHTLTKTDDDYCGAPYCIDGTWFIADQVEAIDREPRAPWLVLREAADIYEAQGKLLMAKMLRQEADYLEVASKPKPPTLREAVEQYLADWDARGQADAKPLRAALAAEEGR